MEQQTGETYREWDEILDDVRKELNKFRKREMPKNVSDYDYPFHDQTYISRYKVGDWVHYKLDYPQTALGKKQPTPQFRTGDYRYSNEPVQIVKVITMNQSPYYRYMLEGIPNASYSEYDLLKSYRGQSKRKKQKEPKTDVKPVVDKKEKSTDKNSGASGKNTNKNVRNSVISASKQIVTTTRSGRQVKNVDRYTDV